MSFTTAFLMGLGLALGNKLVELVAHTAKTLYVWWTHDDGE